MHDKQRKNPNLIRRTARPLAAFGIAAVSIVSADVVMTQPTSPSVHNSRADHKYNEPARANQSEIARARFALFTGESAIKLLVEDSQPKRRPMIVKPVPRIEVMQSVSHRTYEPTPPSTATTIAPVKPVESTTTTMPERLPVRSHVRLSPHEMIVNNNVRFVFDSIVAHGYSPIAAAGITGNLMYESDGDGGDINPAQKEYGTGGGYGMAQFTGGELSRMRSWTTANNLDSDSIEGQTQYLLYDLNTNYPTVVTALKDSMTVAQATEVFEVQYEQPKGSNTTPISGGAAATLPGRIQNAQTVYTEYGTS